MFNHKKLNIDSRINGGHKVKKSANTIGLISELPYYLEASNELLFIINKCTEH